ncbi:7-deoxyloganetin glucosyltransferase [Cinnamomum micranthum f. kanehirae]|uniref:7-deoxyloganetin glucosyltransferase n=1 Tax=Cinnamomum micranthum f. kanehirae TaxID=337451 RepID=A0A3S3MMW6_9MAGN|nr:7-deoxyloganetin glucosyltransferase [Cinnamomum micranthum f. kanehirae]
MRNNAIEWKNLAEITTKPGGVFIQEFRYVVNQTKHVERPHLICIPYPAQGHVTPVLKLAKLLHARGFFITFVNTEFNHNRLLRSRGPDSLKGLDDFRINSTVGVPKISCILSDGGMSFTLDAGEELGIPVVFFWTPSACDENFLTNGSLDMPIDWIRGMNGIRLRDIPSFIRTTDPDDIMLNFFIREGERASKAVAVIMNTFDDLEQKSLNELKAMLPHLYTIGPLNTLSNQFPKSGSDSLGSNLWKEDSRCLEWLENKAPKSVVVFVNFGSITVMTERQHEEFAWGLANSHHPFLWVIRPDLVMGDSAMLPPDFVKATEERGLLANWCAQEKLLQHPSIGVFLTHCGWNSTIESICGGVPVICWPFFAEQQTNCRYACTEWGIGMEIDNNVKREEVEGLVREMMEGEKGKEMRNKAIEWKSLAEIATKPGGSSYKNFDGLVNQMESENVASPHIICIPYPTQGHVTPVLKLAQLLHTRGFFITFVNTEFNHNRLLRSRGPDSLKGLHDFRFETIPDGLPPSHCDATQDIPALCESTSKNCIVPFRDLIVRINSTAGVPKISCILSDVLMSFTLDAAEELGIPEVLLWTTSACGFLGCLHYRQLVERGLIPFKGGTCNFSVFTRFHGWDSRDEQYPSVRSPVFYQDNVILTTACSTSSIEKHKELPKQQQ